MVPVGLDGKTGIHLSGFVRPITSDIHSGHVDSFTPDDTEVGDRLTSETSDLTDGLGGKTEIPLSGLGKPITGDIRSLRMDAPMPKLETDRPQKHRTSQVASVARPEYTCLGLLDR